VAKGMGLDGRIGRKFLHAGPGFGGSCLPKDARALIETAQAAGAPVRILETTMASNEGRKSGMAGRIVAACGGSVAGATIAALGLTFKPNTDDMRDSPSLAILPALKDAGAEIRAYDPAGMAEARKLMPWIDYRDDAYEAARGADALVIVTEWNQFRALDLGRIRSLLRRPLIVDLRNIYRPAEIAAAGCRYVSLGRAPIGGDGI
jgi:UDPglucose 6-dehydrogenase